MSSGMYSALSGTLTKVKSLDTLINKISNASTYGFKKERDLFESVLNDAIQTRDSAGVNFARLQSKYTDFTHGVNQHTGNALDIAIDGDGFFKLRDGDEILLTRHGDFKRSDDGMLTTHDEMLVLDESDKPIELPPGTVEINSDGKIIGQEGEVGQVAIVLVDDLLQLQRRGTGSFSLPAGIETTVVGDPRVVPESIETSNVNIMQEMALMMDNLRSFETLQKVMKTYSKIGSKADELGTVR